MSESLRPLSLGEILDRTAELYRRHLLLFAGIAALPLGAMLASILLAGTVLIPIAAELRGNAAAPAILGSVIFAAVLLVATPVCIAATVFSQAAITRAAVSAYQGQKITIREALASVRPRFWRYLWLMVLQCLLVVTLPAALVVGFIGVTANFTRGAALGAVGALLVLAAAVVIVWRLLGYVLALAISIAEDKPAWPSIHRSLQLSKGTRGRIFVLFLVVCALMFVLSMLGYIPVLIVIGIVSAVTHGTHAMVMLVAADTCNLLINFALQTVVTPACFVGLVIFYYDQRIRMEGYDIEWMMQQAGLASSENATSPAAAVAAPAPPLPAAATVKPL